MKIYTGGGDRGKTSLFSGERVSKYHVQVEAYGDVDELNSVIGALAVDLTNERGAILEQLRSIQSALLKAGAWLAVTPGSDSASMLEEFSSEHAVELQNVIDKMDEHLPELRNFILPGGCRSSAWAHLARTVCRRAERRVVFFMKQADEPQEGASAENLKNIVAFLNRLSDYFFVLARYLNRLSGVDDIVWKK